LQHGCVRGPFRFDLFHLPKEVACRVFASVRVPHFGAGNTAAWSRFKVTGKPPAMLSQVADISALRRSRNPFGKSDDFACQEAGKPNIFRAVIETNLFSVRHKIGLYYGSGQVDR